MLPAKRLERLRALGLPEYQARAYLALLASGPALARDVAGQSGVPRGKIYATLNDLHARGLVEITPERPRRYRATPVADYLSSLRRHHREALERLAEQEQSLVRDLRVEGGHAVPPVGGVTIVRGRRNVVERLRALLAGAEREVYARCTAAGLLRLAHELDEIADAAERGVVVRIRAPLTDANRGARDALAAHADLADAEGPAWDVALFVADAAEAILHRAVPDDARVYRGEDVGVVLEDRALAAALRTLAGEREEEKDVKEGTREERSGELA